MKKVIINFLLGIGVSTFFACGGDTKTTDSTANQPTASGQQQYGLIEKINWLNGKWQNASPQGTAIEAWEKLNDSTMTGKSYFIKGTDTLPAESISIQQKGADLFYIPTVMDQNGGKPVTFKLTSSVNDQWVFENPEHDFPQKITYIRQPDGTLLAEISGQINGEQKSQKFPMTRAN